MHAPIAGSGLNRPAPLYKRYTGHETLPPYQTNVLCYDRNWYRTYARLAYVEADDSDAKLVPVLKGLLHDDRHLTVKLNGRYYPRGGAVDEPEVTDLVRIRDTLWLIQAVHRKRNTMTYDLATLYLVMEKVEQERE